MSTIYVVRDAATRTARIKFAYDAHLVEVLKAVVSPGARSWDKTAKTWTVDTLAVGDFLLHALRLGHRVVETGTGPPPSASAAPCSTDWAALLFAAVGPARTEVVFKALTKVLHPDTGTGDTALMQQLNNARTAVTR